ncbi:purine-nucleoside phosphorylase [Methylocystis echinoides]|uniref:purine-nucleoside phosphorylase n=1 Tax=Methylocystis echinoides TaxID=29468 RepID=UPI003430794C
MTSLAEEAAAIIRSRYGAGPVETALITAGVFNSLPELGERLVTIPYADLPGFPTCAGVEDGEFIVSAIDDAPTVILKGRSTFFETGDPSLMAAPIETLALLGARAVLSTGLARVALAPLAPSSVVVVTDHINFNGLNPLIGAAASGDGLAGSNEAYDKRLLRRIKLAAAEGGVTIHEGVMMWFSGPTFETPAEIKMARQLGADIVGWTIPPEAILARRFGLPFAGIAVIAEVPSDSQGPDQSRNSVAAGIVGVKRLARTFIKARC